MRSSSSQAHVAGHLDYCTCNATAALNGIAVVAWRRGRCLSALGGGGGEGADWGTVVVVGRREDKEISIMWTQLGREKFCSPT
jgi:hypothetical protein